MTYSEKLSTMTKGEFVREIERYFVKIEEISKKDPLVKKCLEEMELLKEELFRRLK